MPAFTESDSNVGFTKLAVSAKRRPSWRMEGRTRFALSSSGRPGQKQLGAVLARASMLRLLAVLSLTLTLCIDKRCGGA
jgi:hypothetical protein